MLLELNINVQENLKFSSRLVVAAGAAVASHPYVRMRLYSSLSKKQHPHPSYCCRIARTDVA